MNAPSSMQKMMSEKIIGQVLIIGTLLSMVLVILGGAIYLLQHGGENIRVELLSTNNYHVNIEQLFQIALSFSPIGMIELGLLILVATQLLRVILLAWFYLISKDYWFTAFSMFILLTLIYSFIWRH